MMKPLSFLAALTLAACAARASAPEEGAPAPAFTLSSQAGEPVSLADFRGKWVVLYFYPKDFTRGCTIEAHEFQRSLARFEAAGAVVLGVSVQDAGSHKDFCAKEALSYKLLADTKREVSAAYGSLLNLGVTKLSARNTFLIDPDGKIARRYLKVDPSGHAARVLADLDELRGARRTP